jgi:type II secretory pathway pseudopilin PulG
LGALGAFTYIEVLLVIVITLLVAALVMPNLVTRKASRDEWAFRNNLRSLARDAQSRALEIGRTVSMSFDKTKQQVQVIEVDINGAERITHTLEVPTAIVASRFLADQNEEIGDSWRVPFYSDGLTTGGGIQFKTGERTWSLLISPIDATPKDLDGPLPDLSFESWPAGSIVAPQT